MKPRAFSLIEVSLGVGLFSLLGIFCFVLFRSGMNSFKIVTQRTALQTDLRRSLVRLEHDLRRASKNLIAVLSGDQDVARQMVNPDGTICYRDGLAVTNLQEWTPASSYDPNGNPLWNEYVIYYASQRGELLRQLHQPPGAPYRSSLPGFTSATYLNEDPSLNVSARDTKVLSQQVEEFRVQLDPLSGLIHLKLLLRQRGGRTPLGARVSDERVEASLSCRPRNG